MIAFNAKKILRLKEVTHAIGLSRSTIYRLVNCGFFPKPIRIGITAVGWDSAELEFWLTERKLATIQ